MDLTQLISKEKDSSIILLVNPKDLQDFAHNIVRIAQEKSQASAIIPSVKYLTIDQVADLLSVSRVTLWSWNKKGILESHRIGNLRRYKTSDIEAIMAEDKSPIKKPSKL